MWSAANTLRRSVGHKFLTKCVKSTTSHGHGKLHYSNLTSNTMARLSCRIASKRNSSIAQRLGPSVFGARCIREFSTNDDSKRQTDEEAAAANEEEEDGGGDDERVSRLPAIFSVPEVWPRLPIITNKSSPIFPNFMKIFEVNLCITKH